MRISKAVIVDLDGTLFDCSHREHLAQQGLWEEFHSELMDDKVNEDVAFTIAALNLSGVIVIAISGRDERFRILTERKMDQVGVLVDVLYLRPIGNFQPDHELKIGLMDIALQNEGMTRGDVLMAIDDRDKVVEAWRNAGIRCWQVQPGGY